MNNEPGLFSEREKEVMEHLLQGKSNKQIALALGISASTVEYHLKNVYKKLGVNSRTEAVLRLGKSVGDGDTGELGKSTVETNGGTADNGLQPVSTRRNPVNKMFVLIGGSFLLLALIVVLVLFNLPAMGAVGAPTIDPSLPDLAITSAYVSTVDTNGRCLPYYGFFVTVANLGDAPAPDVMLVETNTGQEVLLGTINGHQSINMPFVAKAVSGAYGVVADPQNLIVESDENNNSAIFSGATATPPASCLPGLFSDSTPTPYLPEAIFTAIAQNILPTLPAPVLPTALTAGNPTLSLDVLRNGNYHSQDWGEYQLTNGVYYRTPPTAQESPEAYTSRILDQIIFGDINLDGLEDAVVFLTTQNGGSGHLIEMAVVLNFNGSPRNISTLYLGDRVMVEGGAVMNGLIALNLRVQGPNDAACCPSQAAALAYLLKGDQLIQVNP